MRELLLETIHGSFLYNLNHSASDYDLYRVWSGKGRMRQTIGDEDITNKSFDQFMREISVGVPQSLEALWSPLKTVDRLDYLNIHPGYSETLSRYQRTMKSFWLGGDFKRRRHALRLRVNARDYLRNGYFNPRLTPAQIEEINRDAVLFTALPNYYPMI